MMYDLPWFKIILTFINVIDSRLIFSALKILKMQVGKFGLNVNSTQKQNLACSMHCLKIINFLLKNNI